MKSSKTIAQLGLFSAITVFFGSLCILTLGSFLRPMPAAVVASDELQTDWYPADKVSPKAQSPLARAQENLASELAR